MSKAARELAEQLGFDVAADAAGRQIDAAVAPLVAALEHAQKHHCQCSYEGTCIYCKALEQWRTGR